MPSSETVKIVVAGDVTVDWYYWPRLPNSKDENETINWKLYDGLNICPKITGPILISRMLRKCYPKREEVSISDQKSNSFNDSTPKNWCSLGFPNRVLHMNVRLDKYPFSESDLKNKVYRIRNFGGIITPIEGIINPIDLQFPLPFEIINDEEDADLVVIHDIGNGFRKKLNNKDHKDDRWHWPKAIKGNKKPIIIYYMNVPLFDGDLWEYIFNSHHKEKLILILNAEDLRKLGANISRSISWEKTALDFVWEVNNGSLKRIKELPNVIVRFGTEGVIHYSFNNLPGKNKCKRSKLYFDPSSIEESWDTKKFGLMRGISAVFIASLTSKLISKLIINKNSRGNVSDVSLKEGIEEYISDKSLKEGIKEGIKEGLFNSQEFIKSGHGYVNKKSKSEHLENVEDTNESDQNNENGVNDPSEDLEPNIFDQSIEKLFVKSKKDKKEVSNHFECVEIPNVDYFEERHSVFWSILEEKTKDKKQNLLGLAEEIVREGMPALKYFPVGFFGKLTTVDRAEIESFRSIMIIMKEYIYSAKKTRPLSIAVFGYPGSGKSFGITEIAKIIDSENIEIIGFNVSQFTSITDLANAFHRVRDLSLKGKVPLVFFDEFDCTFENRPLGWLRYFLVPMQDGEFMDQGIMHPIGKSIFVFAGGIYKDFRQFCENAGVHYNKQKDSIENLIHITEKFSIEKCPDFVSRLRGYVNILGPNKIDENDGAYIIRRAIILRSLIEEKVPNIILKKEFNKGPKHRVNGIARIDPSLLTILLTVHGYKHGARSMEAIIDMSVLGKYKSWQKASLPPKDQLELHIDGTECIDLLERI